MSDNMDHTHNPCAHALVRISSDINLPQIAHAVEDTQMQDAPVITPKPQRTLEEEKCHRLWRHVQKVQQAFNTQPYTGEYHHGPKTRLLFAKGINSATDLLNLEALSLVICNDRPDIESTLLEPLAQVHKPILRLHCMGTIRRKDHDICAVSLIEAFLNDLEGMHTLRMGEIAVSWDHRSEYAKRNDTDGPASLSLMGDVYQLPNATPRDFNRRSVIRPTAGGGNNFANFFEAPVNPSRPRIVTAKTDDGLRGIVRLEACQMGVATVPELVLAVSRIMKGKLLPYMFEDPFYVECGFGKVEWMEVVAELGHSEEEG
ncbi:hypothetical protein HBI80_081560 [Parastagonospora nodorum]|nr:hypothetical protein HBI80_081560 [Parastagonospora nodorum]